MISIAVISRVIEARIVGIYSCQHPSNVTYSQIVRLRSMPSTLEEWSVSATNPISRTSTRG